MSTIYQQVETEVLKDAVEVALKMYDTAMSDPVTQPAAFGYGAATLSEVIQVDMRTSCLIMTEAIEKRKT